MLYHNHQNTSDRTASSSHFKGLAVRAVAFSLVAVMAIMSLAACTTAPTGGEISNTTGSAKAEWTYVTSVYPLYLAASQIANGIANVRVTNLTEEITGCLHDYQLTTGNMKTLEQADVFIVNGAGLEGYLDQIASDLPGLEIVEAAADIELLDDNPHVWVSISLMIRQVETLAEEMGRLDPTNKTAYQDNANAYVARLSELRQKMHDSIGSLANRQIITVHEAFPYFAHEFGLEIIGVIEREPDSEPSAAELATTIDLIREKQVKAVFAEPQYPASAARQIADESGARLFTLDPVASGDLENLDAYLEAMEQNRQVLVEALG